MSRASTRAANGHPSRSDRVQRPIAVLATVGVWAGKQFVVDPMLGDLYSSQLIARVPDSAVWTVMPLVGLVAMVLGGIAAQVALRSYVRK